MRESENTCTVYGIEYVAIADNDETCDKCSAKIGDVLCHSLGICGDFARTDKRNINWIKKDDQ